MPGRRLCNSWHPMCAKSNPHSAIRVPLLSADDPPRIDNALTGTEEAAAVRTMEPTHRVNCARLDFEGRQV